VGRPQHAITGAKSAYVFCTKHGTPRDHNLFTRRVWYPTLRRLGIAPRTPYQTRHTFATLILAAGENPEWIAKQLGHTDTTLLFTVYSWFVPNLTTAARNLSTIPPAWNTNGHFLAQTRSSVIGRWRSMISPSERFRRQPAENAMSDTPEPMTDEFLTIER
jgi:Phage integrase family